MNSVFEFIKNIMFFWQMTDPPKLYLLLQRHTVALSPVLSGFWWGFVRIPIKIHSKPGLMLQYVSATTSTMILTIGGSVTFACGFVKMCGTHVTLHGNKSHNTDNTLYSPCDRICKTRNSVKRTPLWPNMLTCSFVMDNSTRPPVE